MQQKLLTAKTLMAKLPRTIWMAHLIEKLCETMEPPTTAVHIYKSHGETLLRTEVPWGDNQRRRQRKIYRRIPANKWRRDDRIRMPPFWKGQWNTRLRWLCMEWYILSKKERRVSKYMCVFVLAQCTAHTHTHPPCVHAHARTHHCYIV